MQNEKFTCRMCECEHNGMYALYYTSKNPDLPAGKVQINYCPACGRDLRKDVEHERQDIFTYVKWCEQRNLKPCMLENLKLYMEEVCKK